MLSTQAPEVLNQISQHINEIIDKGDLDKSDKEFLTTCIQSTAAQFFDLSSSERLLQFVATKGDIDLLILLIKGPYSNLSTCLKNNNSLPLQHVLKAINAAPNPAVSTLLGICLLGKDTSLDPLAYACENKNIPLIKMLLPTYVKVSKICVLTSSKIFDRIINAYKVANKEIQVILSENHHIMKIEKDVTITEGCPQVRMTVNEKLYRIHQENNISTSAPTVAAEGTSNVAAQETRDGDWEMIYADSNISTDGTQLTDQPQYAHRYQHQPREAAHNQHEPQQNNNPCTQQPVTQIAYSHYARTGFFTSISLLVIFTFVAYATAGTDNANKMFEDLAMALWAGLFRQHENPDNMTAPLASMLTLSATTFVGGATLIGSRIKSTH